MWVFSRSSPSVFASGFPLALAGDGNCRFFRPCGGSRHFCGMRVGLKRHLVTVDLRCSGRLSAVRIVEMIVRLLHFIAGLA